MSQDQPTLFKSLLSCQIGEAGTIVGRDLEKDRLSDQLYVDTDEDSILERFFISEYEDDGKLLVLTGSAGDGKSALLSQVYKKSQNLSQNLDRESFHLDATGAAKPTQSAHDNLTEFLDMVQSDIESGTGDRKGLAINYGLAIKFFKQYDLQNEYPEIWEAIQKAEKKWCVEEDNITVINLGHRELFGITPGSLGQGVLLDMLNQFNFADSSSPLSELYDPDHCPVGKEACPLHYNIEQFSDNDFRQLIAEILAADSLINGLYLNPRRILSRVSKMILPPSLHRRVNSKDAYQGECIVGKKIEEGLIIPEPSDLIWNSVFDVLENENRGTIVDPCGQSGSELDNQIMNWYLNRTGLYEQLSETPVAESRTVDAEFVELIKTGIRRKYLVQDGNVETIIDKPWFNEYLNALAFFNEVETEEPVQDGARRVINQTKDALRNWSGQSDISDEMTFVDGNPASEFKYSSQWDEPITDIESSKEDTKTSTRPGQIQLYMSEKDAKNSVLVPLNFEVYTLMNLIKNGYNPTSVELERSEGVQLLQSQLSRFTKKKESVTVRDKAEKALFTVETGALNSIRIEGGE